MNALDTMNTEHDIECWVELQIDRLDMKYTLGRITHEEYTQAMEDINHQADTALKRVFRQG